ncbi:predicted protein [Chaetoceros tenuissimus]|uniref:EF-hand domain-containing protein n=1 Tax=Chaetoceros tenuissimus TaxID=426638 RepID=A0AAD3CMG8_9STRA|nr:predicted protein [Chaetoceros tenuissimus]
MNEQACTLIKQTSNGSNTQEQSSGSHPQVEVSAHELQIAILNEGHTIPLDVVLSHFEKADVDNSGSLTHDELDVYLNKVASSYWLQEIMHNLIRDSHFWKGVGYTIAGALLCTGSFHGDLTKMEDKSISLTSSLIYALISCYFVFTFPLHKFKEERSYEEKLDELHDAIIQHAIQFCDNPSKKQNSCKSLVSSDDLEEDNIVEYVLTLLQSRESGHIIDNDLIEKELTERLTNFKEKTIFKYRSIRGGSSRSLYAQRGDRVSSKPNAKKALSCKLVEYIAEEVFGEKYILTERDVELWILREIKGSASSKFIKKAFVSLDVVNDHVISLEEAHSFVTSLSLQQRKKHSCLEHAFGAIFSMLSEVAWLMSICFFAAYLIKSLKTIFYFCGVKTVYIFGVDASAYFVWLKIVGTMEFVTLSVNDIQSEYDELRRAKAVLSHFLQTAELNDIYKNDSPLFKHFIEDGSLTKTNLRNLFEESSIFLPAHLFDHVYHEIDEDHDGVISKEEIQAYLDIPVRPKMDIAKLCFKSFAFYASSSLFIGSIFYVISYYAKEEQTISVTDQIGSIFHILGGLNLVTNAYHHQSEFIEYVHHLIEVMDKIKLGRLADCEA